MQESEHASGIIPGETPPRSGAMLPSDQPNDSQMLSDDDFQALTDHEFEALVDKML